MKYNLSIITKNVHSSKFLKNQLSDLFGNIFKITCHSPDTTPILPIYNADMILLHEPSALVEMQSYIRCNCPLLLMRRTITMDALNKLKIIPENSTAVVVNLTSYMAHETMTNIYQLGIKNIKLIPWAPDLNVNFPDSNYILTHTMYDFLPRSDKPVIVLGGRVLTPDVIMDILSYFNVDMDKVEEIFHYYASIVPSFLRGVNSLLENNRFLSAQWDLLFNKIDKGVALINKNNKIDSFNNLFLKYLNPIKHIPNNIKSLIEYFPELDLLLDHDEINNEVISLMNSKYVVDLSYLDANNPNMGRFLTLEPYTHIQSLHQAVHKKLVGSLNKGKYTFDDIIYNDPKMHQIVRLGKKFASADLPILIFGESGTGKELFASAIHNCSNRSHKPYVTVNCAGISDALLESEFFGYEGSAFTGANKKGSIGLFEKAQGGTLFLDEISEIPYNLQGKLLRALQEKEIRKVGANYTIGIDVRIIAASNKNLSVLIDDNLFRKDLFFRLNVFSLSLPALRKRGSDIKLLCKTFLNFKNRKATKDFYSFAETYDWPGNIRELRNVLDYMCAISDNDLNIDFLPEYIKEKSAFKQSYLNHNSDSKNTLMLKSIFMCKNSNTSTGRRNLCKFFSDSFYKISEMETRSIISELSTLGYVTISKGRGGCQITDKGLEFLNTQY